MRSLAGLPGITVEAPMDLATALDWLTDGMDFADALHLARSSHCGAFVTFDPKLAKCAKSLKAIPVVIP